MRRYCLIQVLRQHIGIIKLIIILEPNGVILHSRFMGLKVYSMS